MVRNLSDLVREALTAAPFTTRVLSKESGLSYDLLRSWRAGRRRATAASALRLALGLEARGRRLLALARQIRREASGRQRGERAAQDGSGPPEKPAILEPASRKT